MKRGKGSERFLVLVVDDDELSLEMMRDFFKRDDLEVYTASDGQQAVDLLREKGVDLVITDLQMPVFSGMEVLREAKKIDADTLVVIITGFGSLETAIEAIKNGAYDYITKPFKLVEMEVVVNNAIDKIKLIRANEGLLDELEEVHAEMERLKSIQNKLQDQLDQVDQQMKKSQRRIDDGFHSLETVFGEFPPLYLKRAQARGDSLNPMLDELERLSRLKDAEVISRDEFMLLKKRLIYPCRDE